MPKTIASTLREVLNSEVMQVISDRTQTIMPMAEKVLGHWDLDLYTRNPGPAVLTQTGLKPTDLDLATFMMALVNRGAVINLPRYEGMRAASVRPNERIVSRENRHGPINGLFCNREAFSFGILVNDQNVVVIYPDGSERTGAPRNFSLVNVEGKWHDGWRRIEFSPSAKENDWLNDKRLWTGRSVVFENFVHPNRWISFYGQYYFITKCLIERLEEEARHLNSEIHRLLEIGISYPLSDQPKEWPKAEKVGEEKSIQVTAFEAAVDVPEKKGEYPKTPATIEDLVRITDTRRGMVYGITRKLRFAARSVELAFFRNGFTKVNNSARGEEILPAWIDAKWERNYTLPGKRKKFNRLVLFQPAPGQQGVAIRYRIWDKTERVCVD